jgi:hypothetical protein
MGAKEGNMKMGYRMEWKCDHCGVLEFSSPRTGGPPNGWEEHELSFLDMNETQFRYVTFCHKCNDQWSSIVAAHANEWRMTVDNFVKKED